ncbi:cyclase family protein [Alteribacillus sp. YIM 98480]|uniref:cyclase family protein n=1 Tax=Alteribacillus sp. YIM 98480 TaxID=2606599 RepID=UPI00131E545E|nr:cyclase family protein [Alteribacillus sp. YIM 98480]
MQFIDLSVPLEHEPITEKRPSRIERFNHDKEGLDFLTKAFGCEPSDLVLSGGLGNAIEVVTAGTHTSTHMDAPWHYAPTSEGKPARTIDDVPLEWCYNNGVRLDFRHRKDGDVITPEELKEELNRINYELKSFDIVLIMTGCDKKMDSKDYFQQPGLGREAVLWLVERGVKIIGIDAWGLDTSFEAMAEKFQKSGNGEVLWQAHFAGIEREYCQLEKLTNLDLLPPHGFKVICFPIKVEKGSGGWSRVVAIKD